jgi:hypothetical protein
MKTKKKNQTTLPTLSWGEAHQAKMMMVQEGEANEKTKKKKKGKEEVPLVWLVGK